MAHSGLAAPESWYDTMAIRSGCRIGPLRRALAGTVTTGV